MLAYYLEGFIKFIELIDANKVSPDATIEGIPYFVNERITKLLGFSLQKPFKKICLYLNFLDLLRMCLIHSGKLQLPSLANKGLLKGNGHQLVQSKQKLLHLYNRLKSPRLGLSQLLST